MSSLWHALVYKPFYNVFILLTSVVPFHDVGFAIILLTILVKTALYPLSKKAAIAQIRMKGIEGHLKELKEKHGKDQKKIAEESIVLYQKHGVNPASGCLPALVQIPFIIGLYMVFLKGIVVDPTLLYPGVPAPDHLNMMFLGVLDLKSKSILLALIASISQFFYARATSRTATPVKKPETPQEEFAQAMQVQMKYVFPVMIGFIAYKFSAAVALYWVAGNIVGIIQDAWIKRHVARQALPESV